MKAAEHTPGPWTATLRRALNQNDPLYTIDNWTHGDGVMVASVGNRFSWADTAAANATLIAAAPAMLDALRVAYVYLNGGPGHTPEAALAAYHAVRAAIDLATTQPVAPK